ncbi:hypothetical protein DFQ28_010644 [Apophysomyces sp. BC1034]|nr:hypothetical protein DFQ28_010644 [Apophysomyces sp. BC1034]
MSWKKLAERHERELHEKEQRIRQKSHQLESEAERLSEYEQKVEQLQQALDKQQREATEASAHESDTLARHDNLWKQNQELQRTIDEMRETHTVDVNQKDRLEMLLQESKEETKSITKHALDQDQQVEELTMKMSEMEQHISLLQAALNKKDEIMEENRTQWTMITNELEEKIQLLIEENAFLRNNMHQWEQTTEDVDRVRATQSPAKHNEETPFSEAPSNEEAHSHDASRSTADPAQDAENISENHSNGTSWKEQRELDTKEGEYSEDKHVSRQNESIDGSSAAREMYEELQQFSDELSEEEKDERLQQFSDELREEEKHAELQQFYDELRKEENILENTRKQVEEQRREFAKTLAEKEQAAMELQDLKRKLASRIPQISSRHSSISRTQRNGGSTSYSHQSPMASKLESKLEVYRQRLETKTIQCNEQEDMVDRLNEHLNLLQHELSECRSVMVHRESKYIRLMEESQHLKEENERLKVDVDESL